MSEELEIRELVRTAQFILDWAVRLERGETTDARTAAVLRKVVAVVTGFRANLTRFGGGVLIHARAVADIYRAYRSSEADRSEHVSAYFALLGPELSERGRALLCPSDEDITRETGPKASAFRRVGRYFGVSERELFKQDRQARGRSVTAPTRAFGSTFILNTALRLLGLERTAIDAIVADVMRRRSMPASPARGFSAITRLVSVLTDLELDEAARAAVLEDVRRRSPRCSEAEPSDGAPQK